MPAFRASALLCWGCRERGAPEVALIWIELKGEKSDRFCQSGAEAAWRRGIGQNSGRGLRRRKKIRAGEGRIGRQARRASGLGFRALIEAKGWKIGRLAGSSTNWARGSCAVSLRGWRKVLGASAKLLRGGSSARRLAFHAPCRAGGLRVPGSAGCSRQPAVGCDAGRPFPAHPVLLPSPNFSCSG